MVRRPFSRLGYGPRAGSLVEARDRFRDDVLLEVRIGAAQCTIGSEGRVAFLISTDNGRGDRRRPENCPENFALVLIVSTFQRRAVVIIFGVLTAFVYRAPA
jgi:hypothetical protein